MSNMRSELRSARERWLGAIIFDRTSDVSSPGKPAVSLTKTIIAMAEHVDEIVVCGGSQDSGLLSLSAKSPFQSGPLASVSAALHHARDRGMNFVLVADVAASIADDRILRMLRSTQEPAFCGNRPELAAFPVHLVGALDRYLAIAEIQSLETWYRMIRARRVDPWPPRTASPKLQPIDRGVGRLSRATQRPWDGVTD